MRRRFIFILTLCLATCMGCDEIVDGLDISFTTDDFSSGWHSWTVGFSDYPLDDSVLYELTYARTILPGSTDSEKTLMISGYSYNQDLFMYVKKKISSLQPNTEYAVAFGVEFATTAPTGVDDSGDYPGEKVYLKVGASGEEPHKVASSDSTYYYMNIDKGNHENGGADMIYIGNIAQTTTVTDALYSLETLNNDSSFYATTNDEGELWVIVGIDSNYRGSTTLYFTAITIAISA